MTPTKTALFPLLDPSLILVQVGLGQSSESERRHNQSPQAYLVADNSSGLTVSFKTNSLSYGNEIRFGFTPSCSLVDLDLT